MVSLKQARALPERLARGETVRLHATVRAGQHAGAYEVVTADHPRRRSRACAARRSSSAATSTTSGPAPTTTPAAAPPSWRSRARSRSWSARASSRRPARTLRFVWPPEIEGTLALLNARPELARAHKAVDPHGHGGRRPGDQGRLPRHPRPGEPALVRQRRGRALRRLRQRQSARFAGGERAAYPLVAPEGGKEPLQAELADFTLGSDHEVYTEGSFGIPAIYLNDWPDRYIHTNFDTPANIDPTKLKRAAFLGAASGYFLANARPTDAPALSGA